MKKYTTPELEIMEFELEDVITVSNWVNKGDFDNGWTDAE